MELSLGSRFECSAPVHIFVAISLQVMASPKDEDREMERIQVGKFLSMNQFQLLHLPFSGEPSATTDQRPTGGNKIYEASAGSQRKRSKFFSNFPDLPKTNICPIFSTSNWPDLQTLYFSISFSIILYKFLRQTRYELFFCFFHSVPSPVVTSVFAATIRLNDFSF